MNGQSLQTVRSPAPIAVEPSFFRPCFYGLLDTRERMLYDSAHLHAFVVSVCDCLMQFLKIFAPNTHM